MCACANLSYHIRKKKNDKANLLINFHGIDGIALVYHYMSWLSWCIRNFWLLWNQLRLIKQRKFRLYIAFESYEWNFNWNELIIGHKNARGVRSIRSFDKTITTETRSLNSFMQSVQSTQFVYVFVSISILHSNWFWSHFKIDVGF